MAFGRKVVREPDSQIAHPLLAILTNAGLACPPAGRRLVEFLTDFDDFVGGPLPQTPC